MMSDGKDDERMFTVVTWNVAGVNSNAFEFSFASDDRFQDAVSFGRYLNSLMKHLTLTNETSVTLDSNTDDTIDAFVKKNKSLTCSQLLSHLLPLTKGRDRMDPYFSNALDRFLGRRAKPDGDAKTNDDADVNVSDALLAAWHGDSKFSKADMFFKARTWSFTNIRSSNIDAFLNACDSKKEAAWWAKWVDDLSKTEAFHSESDDHDHTEHDDVTELMQKFVVPLAIFDGILFKATCHALETNRWDRKRLIKHLGGFLLSMSVDMERKAAGISGALDWVIQQYCPDIVCMQENNKFWQKRSSSFSDFWNKKLRASYEVFDPSTVLNPQQVVQLLVRKSSRIAVDEKKTAQVFKHATTSTSFLDKLRLVLKSDTNWSTSILDEQIVRAKKIIATTWVPAVLIHRPSGNHLLACAAHSNSKGTDNRILVAVSDVLAREFNLVVVIGMDANSNNVPKKKDLAHGAGSRRVFNAFVEKRFKSCFPSDDIEEKPVPDDAKCKYHTVRKSRTFLQMQLKKAEKLDQSLKDWIVSHGTIVDTIRVNNFEGPAVWSEDKGSIWKDADCMPNSHCPSDHCMIVSRLVLPKGGDENDSAQNEFSGSKTREVATTADDHTHKATSDHPPETCGSCDVL